MLLPVRISGYGCTREVWRAFKKLELHSAIASLVQLFRIFLLFNAAARLVCYAPRHCHITPLLLDLHWLPVKEHTQYKVLLFVFKALHGFAPDHITNLAELQSGSKYNLQPTNSRLLVPFKDKTKKTIGD